MMLNDKQDRTASLEVPVHTQSQAEIWQRWGQMCILSQHSALPQAPCSCSQAAKDCPILHTSWGAKWQPGQQAPFLSPHHTNHTQSRNMVGGGLGRGRQLRDNKGFHSASQQKAACSHPRLFSRITSKLSVHILCRLLSGQTENNRLSYSSSSVWRSNYQSSTGQKDCILLFSTCHHPLRNHNKICRNLISKASPATQELAFSHSAPVPETPPVPLTRTVMLGHCYSCHLYGFCQQHNQALLELKA